MKRSFLESVSPAKLRSWHDLLAAEPHVAGTPGDARVIGLIESSFKEMGLKVQRHEFWALLPRPISSVLEIVSPDPRSLVLAEKQLENDAYTKNPALDPGWNAFSGSGDVTGELVYANYGRKEDFAVLAAMGIDVRGKIVLARYGGNFRGYKARFAEQAGAAGLIIYTDPADSGYSKGLLYPEGGYANDTCIERGSLLTTPYAGDALTPGVEATRDAQRLEISKADIPHIPVQPIGYGAALEFMKRMAGSAVADAPATASWQGALPVPYRVQGGAGLRVRLKVEQDREIRQTANVVGVLEGSLEPERLVVIGCHHDAWGFGAADPLAGTITLMEAARVLSEAAKSGDRPRRSIAFCAWGAEEYGIVGSTEWVEGNRSRLATDGVAYFNLDMASMGVEFGSAAGPSIRSAITRAAKGVPQARDGGKTVYEAWLARGKDPSRADMPVFGDLGGGSDHVAFWCHVGVASAGLGASGSKGNSYHSIYDNLQWYRKVVGEDYEPAMMVTRMAAAAARRMADSPIFEIEPEMCVAELRKQLRDIGARGVTAGLWKAVEADGKPVPGALPAELADLDKDAEATERIVAAAVAAWRGEEESGRLDDGRRKDLNERLLATDRAWIVTDGLEGRPWYRNSLAAPDRDSGYASWMLPVLRRVVEDKDADGVARAIEAYRNVLRSLREIVEVPA